MFASLPLRGDVTQCDDVDVNSASSDDKVAGQIQLKDISQGS